MKLEEAIQHLEESLADPTHKWGCEECKAEREQLLEWLEDYKQLKSDYIDLDHRLRTANTENDELKRLLVEAEAMDDLYQVPCDVICSNCPLYKDCKWRHHDEAMKLLGGSENAEN